MNQQADEYDVPSGSPGQGSASRRADEAAPSVGRATGQPEEATGSSRRAFVGSVARKAAFVIPAVWTITAQQAQAAGSKASAIGPSCIAAGQPCTQNSDCCSGFCLGNMMCMA